MKILNSSSFDILMQSFDLQEEKDFAVGVSGGADSLCLTLFLAEWAKRHQATLTALTVNHNLRAVAAAEAQQVHDFLTQHNISHVILTNQTPIPTGGIEEYARRIRYELMTNYCMQNHIKTLFLAHHADDQAETFLLRLSRKSGLNGLKAMTAETSINGMRLIRPFLTLPKKVLTDTMTQQGICWAEDEMNHDEAFTRVQWRHLLPTLQKTGVTSETIGIVTKRLARADTALQHYTDNFIQKNVWIDFRGFARLPMEPFRECPAEIQIRVLQELVHQIGQSDKPISLKALENLCPRLPCAATLGECVFVPHKTGLYIAKEAKYQASPRTLLPHIPTRWDRFLITAQQPCLIRAGMPKDKIENIPACVQKTFPAVFIQKELEKEIQIDYKEKNDSLIRIRFIKQSKGCKQE